MHRVALDVPIYGSRFIKAGEQSLKLIPFIHEQPAMTPLTIQVPGDLLSSDIDMKDYYASSVALDVLRHLRDVIENRFQVSRVWRKDFLVQSVREAAVYPSLKGLSVESIMAVIHAKPTVYAFGDYVCSQDTDQGEVQRFATSSL